MMLLFVGALSAILTWALLHKHLKPLINATLAILGCALEVIVDFSMLPVSWAAKKIDTYFVQPIQKIKKRIHIPIIVRIIFYTLFGILVFYLDHKHNIRMFNDDETFIMYPFEVNGVKFWVSFIALLIGGSSLGISLIFIMGGILKALNPLLNRTVTLHITLYR